MREERQGERKEPVILRGIGVSPGVVIGRAHLLSVDATAVPEREIATEEVAHELCRLEQSLIDTRSQIKEIQRDLDAKISSAGASILDAHLMVLDDGMFLGEVVQKIRIGRRNAEAAIRKVSDQYAGVLASMADDYLRERVIDIHDVSRRMIRNLSGKQATCLVAMTEKHIIIAADLTPSETASLRKDLVMGFATDLGSPTSHTAVMARALEIPAIVALREVSERVSEGDEILVDGNKGVLVINPSAEQLEQYGRVAAVRKNIEADLNGLKDSPSETRDGHRITLSANIETPDEVESVIRSGAVGEGLFRSEYLYLAKDRVIGEDEQAVAYSSVAAALAPAPVTIRTLDLGGDKYLPAGNRFNEMNPFLGCRSIRLSLLYPDQLRSQLRAILKASSHGNVKIMYPMISSATEVVRANDILKTAMSDLRDAGIAFDENVEVGAMIEIPSAALTADIIAQHVQFFSIGTNDLTQYTLAVDRVNEHVAFLYEPTHPAVLRLIKETVEAGHRHGKHVSVCGEMAGDPMLALLLVGLGVDGLSMSPVVVPLVKDAIRKLDFFRAKELASSALACHTAIEVLKLCRNLTSEIAPELLELVK